MNVFQVAFLNPVVPITIFAVLGVLIVRNIEQEALGGAIGGLVVACIAALLPWLAKTYRVFQIRFHSSDAPLVPENSPVATAFRLPYCVSSLLVHVSPRKGVRLTAIDMAIFDHPGFPRRLLPDQVGRRRLPAKNEIRVLGVEHQLANGTWQDCQLHTHTFSTEVDCPLDIPNHSRELFRFTFDVPQTLNHWDGILSFRLAYSSDGTILDRRNVRTHFFVAEPTRRRPWNFYHKHVARATQSTAPATVPAPPS